MGQLPLPCMTTCPLKRGSDPHEFGWYHVCVACLWLRDTVNREGEEGREIKWEAGKKGEGGAVIV
jgi:hypothetical protein